MKSTATISKQADIRYRVELRAHSSIVIYKVKSSDGQRDYEVTLVNGKISSCTCPAHQKQNVRCYIMAGVAEKELEVQARRRQEESVLMDAFSAEMASERRHTAPLNGDRTFNLYRR